MKNIMLKHCKKEYIVCLMCNKLIVKGAAYLRGGEMINFTIYGDPKAKARPRVFSRNGRRMVFSPSARDEQDFLTQALPYKPEKPLICPLGIEIKAYFPIPKAYSKAKREKALKFEIRPAKRPDPDNIAKLVLDSLQGIFFLNDSQVVSLSVDKFYSDTPKTEVFITEA